MKLKKVLPLIFVLAAIIPNLYAIPPIILLGGALAGVYGISFVSKILTGGNFKCTGQILSANITTENNNVYLYIKYLIDCPEPYGCLYDNSICSKVGTTPSNIFPYCKGYYLELKANDKIFVAEKDSAGHLSMVNKIKIGEKNGELKIVDADSWPTDQDVVYFPLPGAAQTYELKVPISITKTGTYSIDIYLKLEIACNIIAYACANPTLAYATLSFQIKEQKSNVVAQVKPSPAICKGSIYSITPTKSTFTNKEFVSLKVRYEINCQNEKGHYFVALVDGGIYKFRYGSKGVTPNIGDTSYYYPGTTAVYETTITIPKYLSVGTHTIELILYTYPNNKKLDSKSTTVTIEEEKVEPSPSPTPTEVECTSPYGLKVLRVEWQPSRVYVGSPVTLKIKLKNVYTCYYQGSLNIYIRYRLSPTEPWKLLETLTKDIYIKGGEVKEVTVQYIPPQDGMYSAMITYGRQVLFDMPVVLYAIVSKNQTNRITPQSGCRLDITKVEVPKEIPSGKDYKIIVYWNYACVQAPENAKGFFLKIYLYKNDKVVGVWKWSNDEGLVWDKGLAGNTIDVHIDWRYLQNNNKAEIELPAINEGGFYTIKVCPVLNLAGHLGDPEDAEYGKCAIASFFVEGGEKPGLPIKIVKVGIYNVTGGELSSIVLGQTFYVCVDVKAIRDTTGTLKVELKPDQPLWKDPVLMSKTFNVILRAGEVKRYCIKYTAKKDVLFARTKYHIDIYWNNEKLGRYPDDPSQDWQVIVPKVGEEVIVTDHGWKSTDGRIIDSTMKYEAVVYAVIYNKATVPAPVTVTFVIKEDTPLWLDSVYVKSDQQVIINPEEKKEVQYTVTFDHDGSYHYEIYINGKKVVSRGKSLSVGVVGWLTKLTNQLAGKLGPYLIIGIVVFIGIMWLMWLLQPMIIMFLYRQLIMMEMLRRLMGKE